MSKPLVTLTLIALALSVASNAQQKPQNPAGDDTKKDSPQKALDTAAASPGAPVDPNSYELGPEDVIFVSVWHDSDFTRPYLIRPDGKISLQLVGEIQASGLTPVQLGKAITAKLSTIIKDPQVDVSVSQVNSKRYYIQGEVNRSGEFKLVTKTTVLEALSNCGGFRDFANKKKIVILRKGQRLKFNYNEVVKGKNPEQNIYLENGDYVIVP